MDGCNRDCEDNESILCHHRFDFNSRVIYCNGKGYSGWPDSKIIAHFFNYICNSIARGLLLPETVFSIVTKDIDFLLDAEIEWKRDKKDKLSKGEEVEEWTFGPDFVGNDDVVVFVQTIDCKNYGDSGRDNLKCAIHKMNKFFDELGP